MDTLLLNNKICAIIVSYNGENTIAQTIKALSCQVGHILIVDNNSKDSTIKILKELKNDNMSVIYNESNKGIGYALNQGIKYAQKYKYSWLLTMDQDSIADENMVQELLKTAAKFSHDERVISFSPAIREQKHKPVNIKSSYEYRYTVITSGNMLRLSIFEVIGEYNELLFIDSVDFDFCLRLKKAGYKIIRTNHAGLFHSLGKIEHISLFGIKVRIRTHSPVRKYYMLRNHIFIIKNYFTTFPAYCLRKQIGMFKLVFQALFLESDKMLNLKYLSRGLMDAIADKYPTLN